MSQLILIVEDDPSVREMVDLMLSQAGYQVTTARDGAAALEMLQHLKPDLVLLDINMPRVSGLEVLRTLRQARRSKVQVLMMTANQSAETVRDVMALGGNGYVLKPFTHEALLARVKKALDAGVARPEAVERKVLDL